MVLGMPRVSIKLAAVLAAVALAMAGCGSSQAGHRARTEVLKSTSPPTSDIYLRITGPAGAVYYLAQHFRSAGAYDRFDFHQAVGSKGMFLPPRVRERKLCAATHVIRPDDAAELQKWRGRTLATTIYGKKTSLVYCAVLTRGLYRGGS
jgi:hypothetical protein